MKVAIVGGTGSFGLALARRLVEAGDEVVIGSRDAQRAEEKAQEVGASRGAANTQAVRGADIVVLAANANAALETARTVSAALTSPLLSVASEIPPATGPSLAERAQELVRPPVVAGLHSLAAGKLAQGRPDEDAFVCGDDEEAKALALELAAKVVAGRALDAGPLAGARALEGLTSVIVNLNRRYKGHAGIRVAGIP